MALLTTDRDGFVVPVDDSDMRHAARVSTGAPVERFEELDWDGRRVTFLDVHDDDGIRVRDDDRVIVVLPHEAGVYVREGHRW